MPIETRAIVTNLVKTGFDIDEENVRNIKKTLNVGCIGNDDTTKFCKKKK